MLFVKEETYTFKEFSKMINDKKYTKEEKLMKQYANKCGTKLTIPADYLSDNELAEYRKLDREVGILMKDKRIGRLLITLTACLAHSVKVFADVAGAKSKMRIVGQEIFGLCQEVAFWVSLIMCAIEIIRALVSGDKKSVTGIVAKYLIGFGALFFLPWLFELIRDIFS